MNDVNPYSTPDAELSIQTSSQYELNDPRLVSFGRGAAWVGEGFAFFKQSAGAWVGTCVVGFIIMLILSIVPLINVLVGFFSYVWLAGLMLGLKAQDEGKPFELRYLFAGFSNNLGKLVLLGVITMLMSFGVMFAAVGSIYFQMLAGTVDPNTIIEDFTGLMLRMLIAMLFFIPLAMAIWFAPALIVLHDLPIIKAVRLSFAACAKNVFPFLLYGIVLLGVFIIGMLPLMLGLLVVMPLFFGSIYASYKDIFLVR